MQKGLDEFLGSCFYCTMAKLSQRFIPSSLIKQALARRSRKLDSSRLIGGLFVEAYELNAADGGDRCRD